MNTNFELCFIRHAPKRNLFSNYELHWPCTLNNENKWQQIPTLWQPHYLSATREDRAVSHSHRQNSLEMSLQPYSCQFILYQHQKQLEKTNMKVLTYQQHLQLRDHALKMLLLAFQEEKADTITLKADWKTTGIVPSSFTLPNFEGFPAHPV